MSGPLAVLREEARFVSAFLDMRHDGRMLFSSQGGVKVPTGGESAQADKPASVFPRGSVLIR